MKFDVIVGNPPYTQGTKLLYRYFFEKSLQLADMVALIMPINLNSKYDSLKVINRLIKTHAIHISNNVSDQFTVGMNNIHYCICSSKIHNQVEKLVSSKLDLYEVKFPARQRLAPIKGNTKVSNAKEADTGILIIDKIYRGDKIIYRKVDKKIVDSAPQKINTNYAVFTNHTPSKGLFNVAILMNPTTTWSMSVFAYEVNTKEEAEKLKKWLQSKFIVNEINKMMAAKNTYAVTLEMIRKLPFYE